MIIGEKPPSNIIKSCNREGVNLTKTITVYKPLSELEQVCIMPAKRSRSRSKSSRRSRSRKRSVTSNPPKIKKAKKARSRVIRQSRILRREASNPKKIPSKWVPDWVAPPLPRRRSKKKIIIRRPKASTEAKLRRPKASTEAKLRRPPNKVRARTSSKASTEAKLRRPQTPVVAKKPSFFKKTGSMLSAVKRKVSNTLRSSSFRRRPPNKVRARTSSQASTEDAKRLRRPPNKVRARTSSQASTEVAERLRAAPIRKVKSASVYSPYPSYSSNLKKPYEDFSNKLRGVRSPHEIMVPQEPIEFRRMVFLQKIPEHLGENVAALKQRMADMEHIQRLLEAQLIKCRKSRTPERAVNNNQLVKIEKRIGELRTEEEQYNKYVQLMREFIGKYNQSKQEEQVKIDRLRSEIHGILKKVSSAVELQSQLFDTQEKILTNITNSAKASKTDLREWAKGIERVANEKDRLIEALVPATLRLQQVPEDTNAQLRESIRELQRIYDKQGTMFGQIPYQPYPQYGSENRVDHRSYQQSYPQSSELTQVLKNAERESLQKQFERLTDLILAKQQQAPAAIFQQQQQQAPQSPAVINNAGATKAELDELKAMISNLTRMVLEKPERKMEPAKWDLPETSSANVRKMQEMQRNRDELLPTGRDKGDYDNQRDILASILLEEQKSQQKPQENQKLAMIEKLLGSSGGKGGDSSALLDFIIKMKLLKGLGFDVSDIFGGSPITNNTNTITNGASGGSAEDKIMQKFEEVIRILKSPAKATEGTQIVDAIPVDDTRVLDLLGQFLVSIRSGDVNKAHGHLEKLKNDIGTQTSNCDELASKLSDISKNLSSLVRGGDNITQISEQVSSMNSQTAKLTDEIKSLITKIQTMASTGQTSSITEINRLKDELESKKEELEQLRNASNPLQGQLDDYKRKFESIKQLLEQIPDCDGLGIIAALKKFKQEIENLKTSKGIAEPLPQWYNDIQVVVKRLFNLNLEINDERTKFIDYLEAIGNFLNENKIDSPETLNVFIGVINENKKCCEDLKRVNNETAKIKEEKTAALKSVDETKAEIKRLEDELAVLKAAEKPDNNASKEEIKRLKAELLEAQEKLKELELEADEAIQNLNDEADKEIKRLQAELEAAKEAAAEAAAEAEAALEAAREEAKEREAAAQKAKEEARRAKEDAERKEAEKAKKAEEAERRAKDAARKAEADRKAKEEADRKAAAEKAERKAAAEKAKKAEEPILKKRRDFLIDIEKKNRVTHEKRVFEKNKENEITVSEANNSATKLYTIPSAIVDRVKDVDVMLPKDVNDLYEIINGIGLVVVRIGGPGDTDGEKLASVENDHITLNTKCNDKEKYGPFLAFGPNDNQKKIYENEQLTDFFKYENDIALFSYGASGSGKTYTLFGNKFIKDRKDDGIIHKIMNDKFKTSQITATAIQWYCGNIYSAYITNNKTYKYELGNSNQTIEGVEVLNAKDQQDFLKIDNYGNSITSNSMLLGKLDEAFSLKGKYDTLFYKYIKDVTEKKDFTKNNFIIYFFNPETGKFIENKKDLFAKILENLKTFDVSRNDKSFASFDNKKQPMNVGDKLLDGHLIQSEDNPFDDTFAVKIKITDADGLNDYLTQVMKSRPTRATAKNPDSSRSHLFIRFQVTNKTNNKIQDIYTCDLGGIEEPLEYFDLAMLEGYWVVLGIKQIGEIIESYNNYKLPNKDDILDDLKKYLYPTRKIPSSPGSTELSFDLQNIRLDNKTIIKNIYFNKLFQLMKYVIGEEKLTKFLNKTDTSALTKIVSFVNVKKQIKKDIDDLARNNACTAAKDSLLFAEKLLKISRDNDNQFGRIARRRSYARKGAARLAPHKQAKRRSFKRSKRPSVGVATSNKARKRSYRRSSSPKVATSQESGLSKLRRRSIRRVRTTLHRTKSLRRKRS